MVDPKIQKQRELLPIFPYRQQIIDAIKKKNLLVITGETGSGKTTQIPQYILENFPECRLIGVTQPRRIAAMTVAKRVSEEHGTRLGNEIGYSIRFDDCTSTKTRLRYMTDGVLLREATTDPKLSNYDVIIVDEAHERTVETDVLFGLLKQTYRMRPELKILVMSATLNVEKFSDFFNKCPTMDIPGRMYHVEINHHRDAKISSLKSTYIERAVDTALFIHQEEPPGDVLVFLTGQNDIERACRDLEREARHLRRSDIRYGKHVKAMVVYPLYASLETMEQRAIFDEPPEGTRKFVFATNIAQTSVTIPGIKYVIDSGFVKQKSYDPNTGMDALLVVPISQAAATQRAGRAGRTAPGKAYRLYCRESYEQMDEETIPEIQRSSLLGTVLSLKKMGIQDIINFEFIDPPDPLLVTNALRQLFLLEAIDASGRLTSLGDLMTIFPLNPFLSRVLISSAKEFNCSREIVIIVSMLSAEEVFHSPKNEEKQMIAEEARKQFYHSSGDHMTLLNIFEAYRDCGHDIDWCRERYLNHRALSIAKNVREQIQDIMEKNGLPIISCRRNENSNDEERTRKKRKTYYRETKYDPEPILQSLATAYYIHLSKRHPHRPVFYHYASGAASESVDSNSSLLALHISPTSALYPENKVVKIESLDWLIYHAIVYTNKALMKTVSKIRYNWVEEKMSLFKQLPKTRLDGSEVANKESGQNDDMSENDPVKKNRRIEAIAAAKERALRRRAMAQE
ncbi:2738_t:CDS:2 [Paraglomus brasilianum]|uniref:RNA helicase n=1 Tax=Paraglomus brasilianum TaxID=144538 RepID=A0A9N8WHN9_9GLOM|nr:2738_t:CDS:2 [Paraglomus brasilianum]